jgi:predicted ATPase
VTHRFGPRGLYVLDVPEAALSVRGAMAVLARLAELVG